MSIRETDPLVIAVDSSTTSSKAIVVDATGTVVAEGKYEIELLNPVGNFYEHEPLMWWETTNNAIRDAVGQLEAKDRERVAAMCVTHQRESFAPFDKDGNPLRNGILWLDGRATDQILRYGSQELHALSGKPADITPGIYKMAWVKENEPDALKQAYKVVDVHGYLVYRLTGEWKSSTACADSLGLFDIAKLDYSERLMDIAGVTREQMSDLVQPGEFIAMVKPEIREGWGILQDIPLVGGLGDGQAAGIGSASVDSETLYLNLGTAIVAGIISDDYQYDKAYRTLAAGIPNKYVLEVLQSSGSFLATWFRRSIGTSEGRPDPELDAAAAEIPIGCGGLMTMPYWNAVQSPHWDPAVRGAQIGWDGSHDRPAMYRSILEATSLEMRRNLEALQASTGVKITTVRAMGGGTRSKLWRQMMTDATGLPITACTEDEISALGAAVLAMAYTGVFGDNSIETAARKMAHFGDVTEPDMAKYEIYGEISEIQGKIYDTLLPLRDDIRKISEKYPNTAKTEDAE